MSPYFKSLVRLGIHLGKSRSEAEQAARFVIDALNGEETAATVSSSMRPVSQGRFDYSTNVHPAQDFSAKKFPAWFTSAAPAFPAASGH
jgi:hypothetical protein